MTRINNIQGKNGELEKKNETNERTNQTSFVFFICTLSVVCFFLLLLSSLLYLWLCNNLYIYVYRYIPKKRETETETKKTAQRQKAERKRVYKIFVHFRLFTVLQYIVCCVFSIQSDAYSVSHIRTILLQTLYIRCVGCKAKRTSETTNGRTNECTNERTTEKNVYVHIYIFLVLL